MSDKNKKKDEDFDLFELYDIIRDCYKEAFNKSKPRKERVKIFFLTLIFDLILRWGLLFAILAVLWMFWDEFIAGCPTDGKIEIIIDLLVIGGFIAARGA